MQPANFKEPLLCISYSGGSEQRGEHKGQTAPTVTTDLTFFLPGLLRAPHKTFPTTERQALDSRAKRHCVSWKSVPSVRSFSLLHPRKWLRLKMFQAQAFTSSVYRGWRAMVPTERTRYWVHINILDRREISAFTIPTSVTRE